MHRWSDNPGDAHRRTHVPLIRVRPKQLFEATILSESLTGAFTHYWWGRTRICDKTNCEPCNAGRRPRWYGYVCCHRLENCTTMLVELTPTCFDVLAAWHVNRGTLRGAQLRLRRATPKLNAPLIAELTLGSIRPDLLPKSVDVYSILCALWEIDQQAPPKSDDLPGQKRFA